MTTVNDITKIKTYTLDQIKVAFIEMFDESGEHWFPYFNNRDENKAVTTARFEEFVDYLNKQKT